MATSLEISKKTGPDRSSTSKKLSFDVKIAKIGPADLQIICLREIIKKIRKKLRTVKYIALPATLPSGLNNMACNFNCRIYYEGVLKITVIMYRPSLHTTVEVTNSQYFGDGAALLQTSNLSHCDFCTVL